MAKRYVAVERRCDGCSNKWSAITMKADQPIYRCMTCFLKYYFTRQS